VSTTARTDIRVQTWLIDIPANECADLLSTAGLGRLGVIVNGRPQIFPVNHVYDRPSGCVVFPTKAGTKLHAALDWPWVAFEVTGWIPTVAVAGACSWSAEPRRSPTPS
jgi:nitroimidazol reductase NimA-like FMN-containing flavoprotein (pyridoxamine 5'-phosphate oxidase superfamily)